MLSYTFRITPKTKTLKNKKQILTLLAHKQSRIKKLLLMEEGGSGGTTETHYHGIIKTNYKRQSLRNFIKNELTIEKLVKAEYALKDKAIEHQQKPQHAYNYICKEGKIYFNHGYDEIQIKQYQENYKKDEEEYKLKKLDKIEACIKKCSILPKDEKWEMTAIKIIITEYHKRKLLPPVGYQLKKIIGRIMMEIDLPTYISAVQGEYREYGFYYNELDKSSHYDYYCNNCEHFHDKLESCIEQKFASKKCKHVCV